MVPYQNWIVTNRTLLEVNQGMKKSRKTDWLFMNQRTKSETGWWLHSLKVKMGLISNISLVEVRWAVTTPWSGFLHVQDSSIIWPPPSIGLLHLWPLSCLNVSLPSSLIKNLWACSIYPLCPLLNHSHLPVAWFGPGWTVTMLGRRLVVIKIKKTNNSSNIWFVF